MFHPPTLIRRPAEQVADACRANSSRQLHPVAYISKEPSPPCGEPILPPETPRNEGYRWEDASLQQGSDSRAHGDDDKGDKGVAERTTASVI